jgi:hypothetical protein
LLFPLYEEDLKGIITNLRAFLPPHNVPNALIPAFVANSQSSFLIFLDSHLLAASTSITHRQPPIVAAGPFDQLRRAREAMTLHRSRIRCPVPATSGAIDGHETGEGRNPARASRSVGAIHCGPGLY